MFISYYGEIKPPGMDTKEWQGTFHRGQIKAQEEKKSHIRNVGTHNKRRLGQMLRMEGFQSKAGSRLKAESRRAPGTQQILGPPKRKY